MSCPVCGRTRKAPLMRGKYPRYASGAHHISVGIGKAYRAEGEWYPSQASEYFGIQLYRIWDALPRRNLLRVPI